MAQIRMLVVWIEVILYIWGKGILCRIGNKLLFGNWMISFPIKLAVSKVLMVTCVAVQAALPNNWKVLLAFKDFGTNVKMKIINLIKVNRIRAHLPAATQSAKKHSQLFWIGCQNLLLINCLSLGDCFRGGIET